MHDAKFQIHCDAGNAGSLRATSDSVSVRIGQRVGVETSELWDSIIILCEEVEDGVLSAKVIVCHPDWNQHLQIAHIRSRATGRANSTPAFELNVKPIHI